MTTAGRPPAFQSTADLDVDAFAVACAADVDPATVPTLDRQLEERRA